jgi:hypothetical protein
MKRASLILLMGTLLALFHVVSCGDGSPDEQPGGDGDGDSDVDGGEGDDTGTGEGDDTGTGEGDDTGTGEGDTNTGTGDEDSDVDGGDGDDAGTSETCGEEFAACCEEGDQCGDGVTPSISMMDGSCSCLTPCTFNECTAGSETGYCSTIVGPNVIACVNDVDFQGDPSDCTTGDTCTTPSGDDNGTCIEMVANDFVTMINRCVLECDNPPTECEAPLICSPEMSMVDNELVLDYDDGHCIVYPEM